MGDIFINKTLILGLMIKLMEQVTPYLGETEKSERELTDRLDFAIENSRRNAPLFNKIVDAIKEKLRARMLNDYARHITSTCQGFEEVEARLAPYCKEIIKEPIFRYLSTLIILDELNDSMVASGLKLPSKVTALDVGSGREWFYAEALYNFLQNYRTNEPRRVRLEGIDPLLTEKDLHRFRKRMSGRDMSLMLGDVLDMNHREAYDFVFMHKMLTSDNHFRKFGLEPVDLNVLMERCSHFLKPTGIQVLISPQCAGEYFGLAEKIPQERRIAEFDYAVNLGDDNLNQLFTPGLFRVYRDGICIAKK